MKRLTWLLLGLGVLVVLALVLFGAMGWPPALAQGQSSQPTQAPATQQPYAGCPRHQGGMMNAASPSGGAPGDCPMQNGAGACPQHGEGGCPMQGEGGVCPHYGEGGCPMQGGAGGCLMNGEPGAGGCPMQGGAGGCAVQSGSDQ